MYQSDNLNGPFETANSYFDANVFLSPAWSDPVDGLENFCYQVTTVARTSDGRFLESTPSNTVCKSDSLINNAEEIALDGKNKLGDATNRIEGVEGIALGDDGIPSGEDLLEYLNDNDVNILIGPPSTSGALAWFNPVTQALTIDIQNTSSPEIIAALLAHETIHHIWDADLESGSPQFGVPNPSFPDPPFTRSSNSIDQEYQSLLSLSQVWRELKGSLVDFQNDAWAALMLNPDGTLVDEDIAKVSVRRSYANLLDY